MKTFYYRQPQLAKRYAMSVRSFQRARQEGRVPAPDLFLGQFPLSSGEAILAAAAPLQGQTAIGP